MNPDIQEEWADRFRGTKTRIDIAQDDSGRFQVEVEVYDLTYVELHELLRHVKHVSR